MPGSTNYWSATEPEVSGTMDTLRIEAIGHILHKQEKLDAVFPFQGLGIVLSGSGSFQVDDGPPCELVAPAAFCIWPDSRFRYGPHSGTTWEERFICFSGSRVQDWLRWRWLKHSEMPVPLPQLETLVQLHQRICQAFPPARTLALDEARLMLEHLIFLLHEAAESHAQEHHALQRLIADWSVSPPATVDLRKTAAQLHFSYSSFRGKFSNLTGVAPYQFLLRMRIDHAARLLLENNLPIKAVAQEAGFGHVESFCRAFHRIKGHTPGAFRKRFLAFRHPPELWQSQRAEA
ncbi:MAG: AraC family transcriptional regulator [Terrimicrobiaceae bacterium]